MRFDVITLFPQVFTSVTEHGISSRALHRGLWTIHTWNPRDVTSDLHRTIDDRPFGGGPGMVMMADPLARCVDLIRKSGNTGPVVAFAPGGKVLDDALVKSWSTDANASFIFVCGRYEGIDERFLQTYVDVTISLGDFVLSGAELPAAVCIDALVRQLPGALKELSVEDESFRTGLLDAPHYTRPEVWREMGVPEVLLSGHHANIEHWTREATLKATFQKRPDLIKIARSRGRLSPADEAFLKSLENAS